jgi:hypothetical protein
LSRENKKDDILGSEEPKADMWPHMQSMERGAVRRGIVF